MARRGLVSTSPAVYQTPMRFLLAVLLAFLTACDMADGGDAGEAIAVTFVADDGTGDVDLYGRESWVTGATHLGLTAHASDGRVVPALATSWRVLDSGRSYIFKLRPATWPDGRDITAGDVVAVLRRQMAPGGDMALKPYLMDVHEAEAVAANRKPPRMLGVDDPLPDVVAITLDRPHPALLSMLAHPSLAVVRREDPPPPSGPYAVKNNALLPNPDWYGAGADNALAGISLTELGLEEAFAAYESGESDIVMGGTTAGLRRTRAPGLEAALRLEQTIGLYGYLARTSGGPLRDVRLRRALAMTATREALPGYFALDGMQPAYGPLAPNLPEAYAGAVPDWATWARVLRYQEAARLLGEAGYGPEAPLTLDVAFPQGPDHSGILETLSEGWLPLGVRIRAFVRPAALHREAIGTGDYDLAAIERIAPATLPFFFLRPFNCGERLGGYCNREADRLMMEARQQDQYGERVQRIRRAARLIAEDAPVIPLFSPMRWALVRPGITGWETNIVGAHPPEYLRREGN
ncbi:MAG: ABC transporter substrate-binding protein [Pacificimonas sp.]